LIAGANNPTWSGGAGLDDGYRELSHTGATNLGLDLRAQVFTADCEAWQCSEQDREGDDFVKRAEAHGFVIVHDRHFRGCLRRLTFDMRGGRRA
jgi:hypothetical protein